VRSTDEIKPGTTPAIAWTGNVRRVPIGTSTATTRLDSEARCASSSADKWGAVEWVEEDWAAVAGDFGDAERRADDSSEATLPP